MRILDQASRKVSETVNGLKKKTSESMAVRKLETQIRSTQAEIEGMYKAIGEAVYEKYGKDASLAGFNELFAGVTALKERADQLTLEVDRLKDVRRCESCGAQATLQAKFCPQCGAKLTELEEQSEADEVNGESCPECGAERKAESKFCEDCGAGFAQAGASETETGDH